MMDEIRRHAAEHETVEGVESLTAHHQKPVPFRRVFTRPGATAPCSLRTVPLSFSAVNCCLASFRVLVERASMRCISSWMYRSVPAITG